jgi:lipopolysaccharide export system permease protein
MKRLDKLVYTELAMPWLFGVAIFTTLIVAGTYLFKLTDYLASGIPLMTVVELSILLIPGVMVKTFPMAMLLACLLGFGRLSSDSEIVAVRAAGVSLGRVMVPVGILGFAVAMLSLVVNEGVVPWAAFRGTAITEGIEKKLRGGSGDPVFRAVYNPKSGELIAMVMARDFNLAERSLRDAWLIGYGKDKTPQILLHAESFQFQSEDDWQIRNGKIFSYDLSTVSQVNGIWPRSVPTPPKIEDIAAARLKDLDSFSIPQMQERIKIAKANPTFSPEQIRNLEYGLHNKVALPLAAIIFGLVGAPLGIRNHRTGAASGFWLSVLIIFGYMMLTRFMSIWALSGAIPAWVASYAPLGIGMLAAMYTIWRKNV